VSDDLLCDLAHVRQRQRESGDYIRAFQRYPEWLSDVDGAKRGAEDNLMEEALILHDLQRVPEE
jgi:hypothetical protein